MTGPALGSSEAASTHHQFHRVAVGRVVRLAVLCSCQQLGAKQKFWRNIWEKTRIMLCLRRGLISSEFYCMLFTLVYKFCCSLVKFIAAH
jgi:hypothetical protein